MKKLILTISSLIVTILLCAQCEFVDFSVSSSTETQIQLYTPSPFLIPNPESNEHFWDISDTNGNVVIQETTDDEGIFFLFEHNIPITDTIIACLTITNELAGPGISCIICDSLAWGGSIVNWEIINEQTEGIIEATQPPIPNYFLVGQSAPCPPRTINFQNFTFGSDEIVWTFPGGEPATSTSNNQLVVYNSPGDFSFTIEVFNEVGSTSFTSTDEITVFPNPVADFNFMPDELSVEFENLSEGELNPGQIIEYLWDFGDDISSTEESPIHVYEEEGAYEVTLSITNQCGTNEITYDVMVSTTGVLDFKKTVSLNVVPNPSNGQFTLYAEGLSNSEVQIRLTDTMGRILMNQSKVFTTDSQHECFSFDQLNSGVYFINVKSAENFWQSQLIIE